jgi:cytochrome c553
MSPFRSTLIPIAFVSLVAFVAAQPAPPAGQAAHMQDHFTKVADVQQAIVRGDLEDVREPARWLAEHQPSDGLPSPNKPLFAEMQKAARQAVAATTLADAGAATGRMVATCGSCHASVGLRPEMAMPTPPDPGKDTEHHMLQHQYAVDLLYRGLVAASDQTWKEGAAALEGSPLTRRNLPMDPALTNDVVAFEAKVHQLADKAADTKDTNGRAAIYGELIAGCGSCHGLHGRVWGPGVPK